MSEINSAENDECDMEDLENRLYARIHHYSGFDEDKTPSTSALNELSTVSQNSRIDAELNHINNNDQSPSDLAALSNRSKKNSNRYWNRDTPPTQGKYHKAKTHSSHSNFSGNIKHDSPVAADSEASYTEDIIAKPKPFTPYISLLSMQSLPGTSKDSNPSVTDLSKQTVQHNTQKSSNRNKISSQHLNPFSKKCVIDQFKSTFDNLSKKDEFEGQNHKNRKRLNPFSALSQDKKKRHEYKVAKKMVATKQREQQVASDNVIDIDDDDDNDDDDVIIMPTQKPPLICVDSSDDEIIATEPEKNHQFIEPAAMNKKSNTVRCDSPSSSIQSADDFVVHTDRRNFGFDNLVTLSDEDLYEASKTVENALRKNTETSPPTNDAANDIFTPPKQIQKERNKQPKRTYEVFESSFAAMDVYESESSDMPDSIYAKGNARKRKISSNSDSDSVESIIVTKSKRLRKRKSSGSAKESEHLDSDESSGGIPANIDTDEENEPTENSYIVRGEALGAVKNLKIKKSLATGGSDAKLSDDEFMNKLSSILHDNASDENEEVDSNHKTLVESIEARDIAESVLQQRSKKKSVPKNCESNRNEINPNESDEWKITDQVGVTDDSQFNCMAETSFKNDCKDDNSENQNKRAENREIDVEAGWNDEMKRFYNDSWGGEIFSVKRIQSKMPKGSINWPILSRDNFPSPDNSRHKIRCLNCQQRGHKSRLCPRPPIAKRCHMCGSEGHTESQCHHKMCLYCGRKTKKFTHGCAECDKEREALCYVCKRKGHKQKLCPDLWKRYHSTKTLAPQLDRSVDTSSPKTKFCPICANKGHTSDTCNSARRYIGRIPISLIQIINYRPVYTTKGEINSEQCTKCILTSSLGKFSFNFGTEVVPYGNRIYARFLRSVKMDPDSLSGIANIDERSAKSVESTVHITEVDDSNDVSIIEENIPQVDLSESASNDTDLSASIDITHDSSNVLTSENDTIEHNVEDDKEGQSDELEILDRQMRTLDELKKKIMTRNQRENENEKENEATDVLPIFDLNSSSDSVDTKPALLDFIPLTSSIVEKFQPVRSPSPRINEIKCDAKIYLTEEHCNALVTKEGHNFLTKCEEVHNVSIIMEWKSIGNVLVVHGLPTDQSKFHEALINFFASIKNESSSEFSKNAPKKREALIKFMREQLIQLDGPLCSQVNVDNVYHMMQKHLDRNTKAHKKKASRLRRQLNMILFGRYGFGEGKTHLQALQTYLRKLIENTASNVPFGLRQKILEHLDYIFSSDDRENYRDLIDQYKDLKKQNNLPPLELDRKLLGLKINVFSGTSVNVTMKNTVSESSVSSPSKIQQSNNRLNVMPSSIDIQINVSTPSSDSHMSKSSTDEIISQNSGISNEWKS